MPNDAGLLLIDDEGDQARSIIDALSLALPYDITWKASADEGLAHLARTPTRCVLLDYFLGDVDGLEALRRIRRGHPDVPVIMVTGMGNEDVAVHAMKLGAADYVRKRDRWITELASAVQRALGRDWVRNASAPRPAGRRPALAASVREAYRRAGVVACGPAMEAVVAEAETAAASAITVLLQGETGTGKTMLARVIHERSRRAGKPFNLVNCAAMPETLLEDDLFGHVPGAFTGAVRSRAGQFEASRGGTVVLDEIGELPPATQAKLLDVLGTNEVRPLGSDQRRHVDVRVIAATNLDLARAVSAGRFRQDLYQRLRAFPIDLPPLRERRDEIVPLADHFLQHYEAVEGKTGLRFSLPAHLALERYDWPGNVRELAHEVHRVVVYATSGTLLARSRLGPEVRMERGPGFGDSTLRAIRDEVMRFAVHERLTRFGWDVTRTAASLGVSREQVHKLLRRWKLLRPDRGPRRS